MLTHSLGS